MKNLSWKEEMKTMVSTINMLVHDGYTDNYVVREEGLISLKEMKIYHPHQIMVVDFFRFEGESDPEDEAILYAIETNDGGKGTLVNGFGPTADTMVNAFIQQVAGRSKKV